MADRDGDDLPKAMAMAWGVDTSRGRGPRRAVTIDEIVRAGIEVALADGLAGVSMARVAERVGLSTMALYRYVPAKDDLLELMVDAALGAPMPIPAGSSWRVGLKAWAVGVRDGYRANPWTLRVPISAPPLGPNNVRWLELALVTMRTTSLSWEQKLACVVTIAGFIRSEELLVADVQASQAAGRDAGDYAAQLGRLITPGEFPQIAIMLAARGLDDPREQDINSDFEFGIERILDGIEVLMHPQDA